jgi:hypothetical protein
MCRQDQRLAGPGLSCRAMQTRAKSWTDHANGLARTMQTKVEGWPGYAD